MTDVEAEALGRDHETWRKAGDAGLKKLCHNLCRRYAAPILPYSHPGLTPRAHCATAAERLVAIAVWDVYPTREFALRLRRSL
jgi:hypothetical protein